MRVCMRVHIKRKGKNIKGILFLYNFLFQEIKKKEKQTIN